MSHEIAQIVDYKLKRFGEKIIKAVEGNKQQDVEIDALIDKRVNDALAGIVTRQFEAMLIPAYQAATQQMFKQMDAKFSSGVGEILRQSASVSQGEKTQLKDIKDVLVSLQKTQQVIIQRLDAMVAHSPAVASMNGQLLVASLSQEELNH